MRKVVVLCLLALVALVSNGQAPLGKGGSQLNAGFGFSGWGVPIYAGIDFGVHPDITVGPQASFRSYSERFRDANGTYKFNHSIFVIGVTGNYHFNTLLNLPSEWNVYGGLTLGYYVWSSPSDYLGNRSSGIGLDAQIGARYFFSDKFGINLEFGGGTASGGKIGITYRMK
jgi:hypothetical protein